MPRQISQQPWLGLTVISACSCILLCPYADGLEMQIKSAIFLDDSQIGVLTSSENTGTLFVCDVSTKKVDTLFRLRDAQDIIPDVVDGWIGVRDATGITAVQILTKNALKWSIEPNSTIVGMTGNPPSVFTANPVRRFPVDFVNDHLEVKKLQYSLLSIANGHELDFISNEPQTLPRQNSLKALSDDLFVITAVDYKQFPAFVLEAFTGSPFTTSDSWSFGGYFRSVWPGDDQSFFVTSFDSADEQFRVYKVRFASNDRDREQDSKLVVTLPSGSDCTDQAIGTDRLLVSSSSIGVRIQTFFGDEEILVATDYVPRFCISPDARHIVVWGKGSKLSIFDVNGQNPLWVHEAELDSISLPETE